MFDKLRNKLGFKTSSLPNITKKLLYDPKNDVIKQGVLLKQGKVNKKVIFF